MKYTNENRVKEDLEAPLLLNDIAFKHLALFEP